MRKILGELKELWRRPRLKILTLFVADRCDARCSSCFYWRELDAGSRPEPKTPPLTLDEYKQIAERLPHIEHLLLSGGEPTLEPRLADITSAFIRRPSQGISLPTNGLNTDRVETQVLQLLERFPENPLVVGVSIDALEPLNDRLRGVPGIFLAALRTLARLAALKPQHPNLRLATLTTLMNVNQDQAPALLERLHELGHADLHSVELLRVPCPDPELAPPDPEKAKTVLDQCNEMNYALLGQHDPAEAALMLSHMRALGREQLHFLRTGQLRIDCLAGRLTAVLERDGRVRLCEQLDPVGNARDFDYDIERLLDSPAAREQLRHIKSGACACAHCVNIGQSIPYDKRAELRRILDRRSIEKSGRIS